MRARSYYHPLPSEGIRHPGVWLGVIGVTLAVVVLFDRILWISVPMILAVAIYYVCAPGVDWLKRLGLTHPQAVWVLALLVGIGCVGLSLASVPWLSSQIFHLQEQAPAYMDRGNALVVESLQWLETRFPALARSHLAEEAQTRMSGWTDGMLNRNVHALLGFLGTWLPSLLLVPYLTFFFLRDGANFKKLLMRGVPNAFFDKVMLLFHRMDYQIHQYFRGMMALTVLDTLTLGAGLWIIGRKFGVGGAVFGPSHALFLGFVCAVLAWLPYVGSAAGCGLVVLVCASEAPGRPVLLLSALVLFVLARLIDDFFYSPMTVGKSLNIHPLLTVVMIFVSGSVAGVPGLFLVLPVLGICSVAGEVFERVWFDEHLRARHAHAVALRKRAAAESLKM